MENNGLEIPETGAMGFKSTEIDGENLDWTKTYNYGLRRPTLLYYR